MRAVTNEIKQYDNTRTPKTSKTKNSSFNFWKDRINIKNNNNYYELQLPTIFLYFSVATCH